MDAPLLIEAPIKESADRTPAWVHRADWSSKDALIAFWSAHPPEIRDDFLNARAESYTENFWAQIRKQRAEQSKLWHERAALIEATDAKIAELPDDLRGRLMRKDIKDEAEDKLLALRARMRVSRSEVRRAVRYLRALQPKARRVPRIEIITPIEKPKVVLPRKYKVISLWQPWAQMIVWGLKMYETRSWQTSYRGTLLIHAARRWTQAEKDYCSLYPFNEAIAERLGGAISDLPLGFIVGIAELVDILPTDNRAALKLTREEDLVGNFLPGRFAWKLRDAREFSAPIAVRGEQGLFEWTGVIDG